MADRLAKEAAVEAKELQEETSVVTVKDIKGTPEQVYEEIGNRDGIFVIYLCKPFLKTNLDTACLMTTDIR